MRLKQKVSKANLRKTVQEKEILEQLINNMPDRIYYKDSESRFIFANKHVSKIMGANSPEELLGKTDFDFYKKKYAQAFYDSEQEMHRTGEPIINKEETGLNLKGDEITVSTTKIPIKNKKKEIVGIIGIGRDITPQKEAEKELNAKSESLREANAILEEKHEEIQQMAEELNTQAENLRNANQRLERLSLVASKTHNTVVIMDGNGNFEWVNDAFVEKYQLSLEEFTKKYGINLRDSSSNSNISAVLNQIYITRKPYTYNSKHKNDDGSEIWNQTNISPITNDQDEITHLILIDSDITELKLIEEQNKKQNKEIKEKSRQLEKTNAMKDRLFSIIAHDLKNPFHSIIGFTNLLLSKYKYIEREKLKELLEMMNESTSNAYQLLENLLEWARAQTKRVKYNPTNVNTHNVVNDIISLIALQASNKNIKLSNEIPKDLIAFVDRNMLNTIIRNITSNAIKFTEKGSITFAGYQSDKGVVIEIVDTGIGMSKEKVDNLFKLGAISSSSGTSGEQGTGLGLIVCMEFIKINKGSIQVNSEEGKGSSFIINLPLQKKN